MLKKKLVPVFMSVVMAFTLSVGASADTLYLTAQTDEQKILNALGTLGGMIGTVWDTIVNNPVLLIFLGGALWGVACKAFKKLRKGVGA